MTVLNQIVLETESEMIVAAQLISTTMDPLLIVLNVHVNVLNVLPMDVQHAQESEIAQMLVLAQ